MTAKSEEGGAAGGGSTASASADDGGGGGAAGECGGADAAEGQKHRGLQGRETVVSCRSGESKPYQAKVTRGGKSVALGSFATAEEAALCYAKTIAEQSSMVLSWLNFINVLDVR